MAAIKLKLKNAIFCLFAATLIFAAGCAVEPPRREIIQSMAESADENLLCSESIENADGYTKHSLALMEAEKARRGGIDCSPIARMVRATATASVDELCAGVILGAAQGLAIGPYSQAELNYRKAECDPQRTQMIVQAYIARQQQLIAQQQLQAQQAQAEAARQQAASQALLNGLFLMQQAQPQPQYSPPISCTSWQSGIFRNTNCQ